VVLYQLTEDVRGEDVRLRVGLKVSGGVNPIIRPTTNGSGVNPDVGGGEVC